VRGNLAINGKWCEIMLNAFKKACTITQWYQVNGCIVRVSILPEMHIFYLHFPSTGWVEMSPRACASSTNDSPSAQLRRMEWGGCIRLLSRSISWDWDVHLCHLSLSVSQKRIGKQQQEWAHVERKWHNCVTKACWKCAEEDHCPCYRWIGMRRQMSLWQHQLGLQWLLAMKLYCLCNKEGNFLLLLCLHYTVSIISHHNEILYWL